MCRKLVSNIVLSRGLFRICVEGRRAGSRENDIEGSHAIHAAGDLTLQIVEMIHYGLDVESSVAFYRDRLGWPVVWHSPGNVAILDAGGAYILVVCAAKWSKGWAEGAPLPKPQASFESKNLEEDLKLLSSLGVDGVGNIEGDPESMMAAELKDPEGIEHFLWQDMHGLHEATKTAGAYYEKQSAEPLYKLGECVLFVNDIAAEERFYAEKLGFEVVSRHGGVFAGMRKNGGPVLGLYRWTGWWEKPVPDAPEAAVRLFLECPDILAEHARQAELGASPGKLREDEDGLKWFTSADPDGNEMSFWQFAPR